MLDYVLLKKEEINKLIYRIIIKEMKILIK